MLTLSWNVVEMPTGPGGLGGWGMGTEQILRRLAFCPGLQPCHLVFSDSALALSATSSPRQ